MARDGEGPAKPARAPRALQSPETMDRRLLELERAFTDDPHDGEVAKALARASLRAGRHLRALTVARPTDDEELRRRAATAVAVRLGIPFRGLCPGGFERFGPEQAPGVLIPGGAFLDDGRDGTSAQRSTLLPGARRADLRRVALPDIVMAVDPEGRFATQDEAGRAVAARHARLPTAAEWKKALRGGCFLDGDATAAHPNPLPDRIAPWGLEPTPPLGRGPSPYGITFDLAVREWCADLPDRVLTLDLANGRYSAPVGHGPRRLQGAARWVRDVPPDLR